MRERKLWMEEGKVTNKKRKIAWEKETETEHGIKETNTENWGNETNKWEKGNCDWKKETTTNMKKENWAWEKRNWNWARNKGNQDWKCEKTKQIDEKNMRMEEIKLTKYEEGKLSQGERKLRLRMRERKNNMVWKDNWASQSSPKPTHANQRNSCCRASSWWRWWSSYSPSTYSSSSSFSYLIFRAASVPVTPADTRWRRRRRAGSAKQCQRSKSV